jgi:putative DNA primase/helicase
LFFSWKGWADRSGEFAGSTKRFAQNLETRGFERMRRNEGRGFQGLRTIQSETSSAYWTAKNG